MSFLVLLWLASSASAQTGERVCAIEAIRAGTSVAAKAIGLGEKTGTLEPGKWAVRVSVKGNPLEDLSRLSHGGFIMVGGRRYDGLSYR